MRVLLILLTLCFIISGCSNPKEKLIGAWKPVHIEPELEGEKLGASYRVKREGERMKDNIYNFYSDGSYFIDNGYRGQEGYYLIDSDMIIQFDKIKNQKKVRARISRITDNEMTWFYDLGSEGGIRLQLERLKDFSKPPK